MAEPDLLSFGIWSGLTILVVVVAGLAYTAYRGKKNEKPPS